VFTYNRPGFFYWEGLQLIKNTPVSKLIKPLIDVSVYENDSPAKAAEIIINRRITILPILNDELKPVGIIRPVDLLPFIKGLFENAPVSV
jgi:CBS domain-containing protein